VVNLSGIAKRYGSQVVLDDVTWAVPQGARVGLTGPNGAGKSTLLRIIAGELEPDAGTVATTRGARLGYLPQHVLGASGVGIRAHAMEAFAELHALAERREALEHQLATVAPDDAEYQAIMDRYMAVCEDWDHRGRYDTESEAESVLCGLGFRADQLDDDCGTLSGGWQMRVALAQLLLRRPDVLLLDEPTNYLDLEARNWLEEFLAAYPGTLIMVAHDRYFLDVTVDHIAEVLHGRVTDYPMNYSRYLRERETRLELARQAYANQQEEIERIESFISRFRYQASKAALVQSRIKQLEKIDRLPPPEGHDRALAIRLPEAPRSGRIVLELTGARKCYNRVPVYDGADVLIERGQRVALVGPNGAGKTTLLKMLAGVLPLDGGERRVGQKVEIGYFAQDSAESLDPTRTVYGEMMSVATVETAPRVRGLLGAFLFSGDAVDKKVGVLSGGERSRLALAKLLIEPVNVLLLDELPSLVIEVGDTKATRYLGNYEDYLRAKAAPPPPPPVEARPATRKRAATR
jgi:ATP-binding cassette, subfamily F, member 3